MYFLYQLADGQYVQIFNFDDTVFLGNLPGVPLAVSICAFNVPDVTLRRPEPILKPLDHAFEYIYNYITNYDLPPSAQQIARFLSIPHYEVSKLLNQLVRKGKIEIVDRIIKLKEPIASLHAQNISPDEIRSTVELEDRQLLYRYTNLGINIEEQLPYIQEEKRNYLKPS